MANIFEYIPYPLQQREPETYDFLDRVDELNEVNDYLNKKYNKPNGLLIDYNTVQFARAKGIIHVRRYMRDWRLRRPLIHAFDDVADVIPDAQSATKRRRIYIDLTCDEVL